MTFTVTRQRAQEVHDLARARAGLPYGYGGAFTRNPRDTTDCSGLVLQTAAWYGGRADWPGNRYGSTESFRLNHQIVFDLGFKRLPAGGVAALPFKPVMLVGLQHGGGGIYSHTACTLMTMDQPGGPVVEAARGVDWESQGDGVFLYDGARAWNDPLFHDFWYLDARLEPAAAPVGMTVDTLADAMGNSLPRERYAALHPAFVEAMRAADITNINRAAMWCAQLGHESGGLRWMEEIADGSAYEGRTDLGNTRPGDGRRFKGRGPIQVTGRANYTACSAWAFGRGLVPTSTYFVDQPDELASDRYGFIGPVWYWTAARPQLNRLSDARDLDGATRAINGGTNGIDDRRARWSRCLALGDRLLPPTEDGGFLMSDTQYQSFYVDPDTGQRSTFKADLPTYVLLNDAKVEQMRRDNEKMRAEIAEQGRIIRALAAAAGVKP